MTNSDLGKKIVIVGVSASGKSTFARTLSKKIDVPLTLMDSIMWNAGWNYVGDEETNRRLIEISKGSSWIIEGYITKASRAALFDAADSIVYLDYSPHIATWRYVKRWWNHRKIPREELKGSPEIFSFKFLWLVWTKGESITLNKFLNRVEDQSKIYRLSSPKKALSFLDAN